MDDTAASITTRAPTGGEPSLLLSELAWLWFCKALVRVFYRRVEVVGRDHLPRSGALVVCANHANSLADVAILQHACPRILHPLARSGLFRRPILRIVLWFIRAVPIYRAHDADSDTAENRGSFDRCFEFLAAGDALMIFPEGISHSEPSVQKIKTGVARIALGSLLAGGPLPKLVPAGLTFLERGRFRSRVLLQFGPAIPADDLAWQAQEDADELSRNEAASSPPRLPVRDLTERVERGIRNLTLNADSWQDLALIRQLERFFHFRAGRHPSTTPLSERFRTFQRLLLANRRLAREAPEELARLRRELRWFERLRELYGIEDYHLSDLYTPARIARRATRSLVLLVVMLPFAAWGSLTSIAPWLLVGWLTPVFAGGPDQYDTTKMMLGLTLFSLFWGGQTWGVYQWLGLSWAVAFALSLPLCSAVALLLLRYRRRIAETVRAYRLFRREADLQAYLLARRQEIESHIATLTRRLRRPEVT